MTDESDLGITRRSMLRRGAGAAGAGFGLAAAAGSANAGCIEEGCPKCDEEKGGPTRFLIAHHPPGNPDKCIELCLPKPAAEAHLREHPDSCGPCPDGNNVQDTSGQGKKGKK